eukprot:2823261-Rhodomonas_salina.1
MSRIHRLAARDPTCPSRVTCKRACGGGANVQRACICRYSSRRRSRTRPISRAGSHVCTSSRATLSTPTTARPPSSTTCLCPLHAHSHTQKNGSQQAETGCTLSSTRTARGCPNDVPLA